VPLRERFLMSPQATLLCALASPVARSRFEYVLN
jgi:hypothetical protein